MPSDPNDLAGHLNAHAAGILGSALGAGAVSGIVPRGGDPAEVARMHRLAAAVAQRQAEALVLYEPLPGVEPFHACRAPEALLYGSNRAGKTLGVCAELARALVGRDPHGKYPLRDGRCYVVGKDNKHVGEVLWRKLSRAGQFKIVRDPATKRWRAVRPWQPWDDAHRHLWKPAPPLIPNRFIEQISWENKAQGVPNLVKLTSGWELAFFSSKAQPPQGVDLDLVVFDEEIVNENWYSEMAARLMDRGGKFRWSATPQAGTEQLYDLFLRSQEELAPGEAPLVQAYFLHVKANPHIAEKEKALLAAKYTPGTTDYEVRIEGRFAILQHRVYPTWDPDHVHGVDPFEIPADWTTYASIDPGKQTLAVIFGAVPPPGDDHGDGLYLYDELYLHNCDAVKFAEAMARKCVGRRIEAFIIDHRMGRTTEVASGRTVEEQYAEQLKAAGCKCKRTGYGFVWGSDDVRGGIEMVQGYLHVRPNGTPRLKVLRGCLPNLDDEMARYRWKRRPDGLVLDEVVKKYDHAVDALRMLCLFEPTYVQPRRLKPGDEGARAALKAKQARMAKSAGRSGTGYVRLGPGQS